MEGKENCTKTLDHLPDRNCKGYAAINVDQCVDAAVGVEGRIGLPLYDGLLVLGCRLVLVVFLLLGNPDEGGLSSYTRPLTRPQL